LTTKSLKRSKLAFTPTFVLVFEVSLMGMKKCPKVIPLSIEV